MFSAVLVPEGAGTRVGIFGCHARDKAGAAAGRAQSTANPAAVAGIPHAKSIDVSAHVQMPVASSAGSGSFRRDRFPKTHVLVRHGVIILAKVCSQTVLRLRCKK